ncbi:MAG: hypothetical protein AMJ60_10110 [Desulfobacterales bacterium SG8_35]|nr:MAG: hypothetical protein AMJ60_10110 [Desulfobacterales bacterium SG8_35]
MVLLKTGVGMSRKIVSISYINGSAEFIEVERSQSGSFILSPPFAYTSESLQAACTRADEIYINGLFPTTSYEWETFPKVQERYLHSLITGSVQKKKPGARISTRFQYLRDVVKEGNAQALVAFQSIDKYEIESVFDLLRKFRKKVKYIYTLPTALAGALLRSEKPAGNSLLLWFTDSGAIIALISPDGLVKIARTLPYGLPGGEGPDAAHIAASNFSKEINREVMRTVNYFKQKFREPPPADIYLLGDKRLQTIFTDYPIKNLEALIHYGLSGSLPEGIEPEKFNRNIHLLGSLWANESFNFLPLQEIRERKADKILTAALIGLVLLIGLAGFWTLRIPGPRSHQDLISQMLELQFDIQELETSIAGLKPIEGRKRYYQSAFLAKKPEFIKFLQQIAAVVPAEMLFDSFSMTPGEKAWNCTITGKIKGQNWQKRLDTLREFGRSLYSFANIDIQNVSHTLGQAGMDAATISFQLSLQFIPGEEKR